MARPASQVQELAEPEVEVDLVGDVDGTNPLPQKALQDTIWIADWTHDTGAPCSEAGWTHVDNHILNDGVEFWHIETGFTTATGMAGNSFAVGYHGNFCCVDSDGYDNGWYQGIRIHYTDVDGAKTPTLSLDYIVDSEAGFDFLNIETDSSCMSFARMNFNTAPNLSPANYRKLRGQADGLNTNGEFNAVALDEYGAGMHCVYISFFADGGFSPCDGDQPTTVGEGTIVDNIVITDGSGTRTEDFEDGTLDLGTALNISDSLPFGTWARLYQHITDNDACVENSSCAWLWTDHTTPTLFNDPSMAFGPGGYVVRNWLDDIIVSPWVSLVSTPTASGTVLRFRRFPGNFFQTSRITANWSVRGKDADCISNWGHAFQFNSLGVFTWLTLTFDMAPYFDPSAAEIQIRHRVVDFQFISGGGVPVPFVPGPGPYTDHTRIGRRVLTGPVINEGIDSRSQGQDAFATEISPIVTPAGQHFRPTTDRFGACAFSQGTELGINKRSPNLITGDSISVQVLALRPVPGGNVVTSVTFHGAVVAGPHLGKAVPTTMATAPPPWSVGPNGFFSFAADTVRSAAGTPLANNYFVDMDDFYFRGGDVLQYLWTATDVAGGFTSDPVGLTAPPTSIADARTATGGLFEVNFLPAINWHPAYRTAILADDYGDIAPTAEQLANSTQKNCMLYVQNIVTRRRSGQVNRTSFMYSLDRLGYGPTASDPHGHYDVYDHQGMGNTNNQLGGRTTIQQCQGYSLIVYDNGNGTPGRPLLPNGVNIDSDKIDQATWFVQWLAQGSSSAAGRATLWMLGSNTVEERSTNGLIQTTMGVTFTGADQSLNVNPQVDGVASFTFDTGTGMLLVDFSTNLFSLSGGCPVVRNYDAIDASGSAVRTHRYRNPVNAVLGAGAIVMNRNDANASNTIQQTHPWFDIRDNAGTPAAVQPELVLLQQIIFATLPLSCLHSNGTTRTGEEPGLDTPRQTMLHQNVPNPFNPITEIRFDLAQSGRVQLRIYDVAGRLVRRLIDEDMAAGRNHTVAWNGLDDQNNKVASGVYFYRLDAIDKALTKKMVVMK